MFDLEEVVNLVHRAQQGDDAAFTELYVRYNELVYRTACKITKDGELAFDMASDAWVRVVKKINTFNFQSQFGTWVSRITINECLMHLRKVKPRLADVSLDAILDQGGSTEGTGVAEAELCFPDYHQTSFPIRDTVHRTLHALSPKHREFLTIRYLDGDTPPEMAERYGRTLGAVKSDLCRGARAFREKFLELA